MTAIDANQALAQSIGEHAVQAVDRDTILELTVILNNIDMSCQINVALRDNSDGEQRRVLESLFDVQALFFEEVSLTFDFVRPGDGSMNVLETQRQYSFA
jgi:hypothetical protein